MMWMKKQKIYTEISRDILKEKDETNKRLRWGHILRMKKLIKDWDEKGDLHRDKWRHLERKKNNINKKLRWGHI